MPMYIADQAGPAAIGGEELNQSQSSKYLIAEIDIQLRRQSEINNQQLILTDTDINLFLENVSTIPGGEEYLTAICTKFPQYKKPKDDEKDICVDRQKWKEACWKNEIPLPPRFDGLWTQARSIFWYDTVDKKMLRFNADRLEFIYDPRLKKQIPIPVLSRSKSTQLFNNVKEILLWVDEYESELNLEVVDSDQRSVILMFPRYVDGTDMKPAVEAELYAARFRYEISDA